MERVLPQYYIKKIDTFDNYSEDFFAESNEDTKIYKFKKNEVREIYNLHKLFFKNTKDENEKKLLKNFKLKKFGKFNIPERWYGIKEKMYCRELYSFVNYENILSRFSQNRNFDELTHLNLIKSFES